MKGELLKTSLDIAKGRKTRPNSNTYRIIYNPYYNYLQIYFGNPGKEQKWRQQSLILYCFWKEIKQWKPKVNILVQKAFWFQHIPKQNILLFCLKTKLFSTLTKQKQFNSLNWIFSTRISCNIYQMHSATNIVLKVLHFNLNQTGTN